MHRFDLNAVHARRTFLRDCAGGIGTIALAHLLGTDPTSPSTPAFDSWSALWQATARMLEGKRHILVLDELPYAAESDPAAGVVGTMVAGNEALDYAVIRFDPAKVTPTNNVNGFVINGLGPDPTFGQVACKLGRTTGQSCGVTWGPGQDPGTIVNQVCGAPGDSGAPVTVDNKLVGMIHGAYTDNLPTCVMKYIPLHTPAVTMSFTTQLADITAKDRPGTGFRPYGT